MKSMDRPLTEKEIAIIINDILHGLIYIQQLNIIHRNLKLTNILINEKGIIKLNNFSKSTQNIDKELLFLSKEKNNECLNDSKYDVFLLGIICIELFLGIKDNTFNRKNFIEKIKNNKDSIQKIIDKDIFSLNDKYFNKEFVEFVQKCLEINPIKRKTAFELSNHPFVKKTYNESEKERFINAIKDNIERIENNKK